VVQGTTSAGILALGPFTILSSGSFAIEVTDSTDHSLTSGLSTAFSVTNKPASFVVTLTPTTLTSFFNFDMDITIKGEDSSDFILTTDLAISTSDSSLIGTLTKSGVLTLTTFTALHFNSDASKTIIITSAAPYAFTYNYVTIVAACKLMITSSILPTTSKDTSSFTVGVYNADDELEAAYGPHTIVLELIEVSSTSGKVTTGTLSLATTAGVAAFSSIFVLSSGTFNMKASSGSFTTASTANFVVTNYVKAIAISTASTTEVSAYQSFDVTVVITGDDDLNYILGSAVSLTAPATMIRANSDLTSADGNAVYQLHSTISGLSSISVATTTGTYSGATVTSNGIDMTIKQDKIVITTSVTVRFT
jgi:hypothetical protein